MIIDALDVTRQRKPLWSEGNLAERLATLPLCATPLYPQGEPLADWHEPTLVWHPEVPAVAFIVDGGAPMIPWDFGIRIPDMPADQPHKRSWELLCLCSQCDWQVGDSSDWTARSFALASCLRGLRADARLPVFEVYVADKANGVAGATVSSSRGVEWLGLRLLEPWQLASFAKESGADFDPLRRSIQLYDFKKREVF